MPEPRAVQNVPNPFTGSCVARKHMQTHTATMCAFFVKNPWETIPSPICTRYFNEKQLQSDMKVESRNLPNMVASRKAKKF